MYRDKINLTHIHIRIPGLKRIHRFLHLTDAHLLLCDERDSEARRAFAESRRPVLAKGDLQPEEALDLLWRYIAERSDSSHPDALDGLLLTGDMVDFPSQANMDCLTAHMDALTLPYVFAIGNHDWAFFDDCRTPHSKIAYRPLYSRWCEGNPFVHKKRIGGMTFVAVDNSLEAYEDGVAETVADALHGEEHVILLQHNPFYSETMRDPSVDPTGRLNNNWKDVLALITAETSPVRAVIAGHLHVRMENLLGERVPQYVTDHAAHGNGTIFTFGE